MEVKTIILTGAECDVTGLKGSNAHIRNDGTSAVYASKTAGIAVGADGVMSIPAGQSAVLYGISGTLHLLGSGSATVVSSDYAESPFKSAVTLGSVTGEIERAVSNPNLLINPDFRINQRGEGIYTGSKYTVDRWYSNYCDVSVNDGYITITKNAITGNQQFGQYIPPELFRCLCGKIVTFSVDCDIKVAGSVVLQYCADGVYGQETRFTDMGRKIRTVTMKLPDTITSSLFIQISLNAPATELTSVDLYSAKLELGGMATPFVPPDPATELAKCQRYFYRLRSYSASIVYRQMSIPVLADRRYSNYKLQLPVCMRKPLSVSLSGSVLLQDISGNEYTPSRISFLTQNTSLNDINMNAYCDSPIAADIVFMYLPVDSYIDFYAEI